MQAIYTCLLAQVKCHEDRTNDNSPPVAFAYKYCTSYDVLAASHLTLPDYKWNKDPAPTRK
jgi:hypothetical protein